MVYDKKEIILKYFWPICAKCKKPVDDFQIQDNFLDQDVMFAAICHGKTEIVRIYHMDFYNINPGSIKHSIAFNDNKALPSKDIDRMDFICE